MPGNLTDFGEVLALTAVTIALGDSGALYASLHTAALSDASGPVVPATTNASNELNSQTQLGYTRMPVVFGAPTTTGTVTVTNVAPIIFPPAQSSWGTVSHLGLWDATGTGGLGGNMVWWVPLSASAAISTGQQFQIAAGSLSLSMD